DVGAFGGASEQWLRIGRCVHLHGFEANAQEARRLQDLPTKLAGMHLHPVVVAERTGPVRFYLTKSPTCSSTLEPNNREFEKYGLPGSLRATRGQVQSVQQLDGISLDDFCRQEQLQPDFVKLDTQGSELSILRDGFCDHLPGCLGLEVEVEFVELYKGQPLFSEVELFLRQCGFELFGLKRNLWKMNDGRDCALLHGGRVTWADALFFHRRMLEPGLPADVAVKAALLCHRFCLYDVLARVIAVQQLDPAEIHRLIQQVDRSDRPSLLGRIKRKLGIGRKKHRDRGVLVEFDEEYGF
ncbi:MAG: FkbM family methyltransferase, partial [Phycisphaerae bacterium]